jgi:predicted nucleic acid-binding protein
MWATWKKNMSKEVFIDTDIILDLLCKREPFYPYAAEVFTRGDKGILKLVTTPLVFANVFYILRKLLGIEKAKELLRKLRIMIGIIEMDDKVVDLALNSSFSDFEDGIQYFSAREHGISTLLTRNIKDYKGFDLIIQTPEEYLKAQKAV